MRLGLKKAREPSQPRSPACKGVASARDSTALSPVPVVDHLSGWSRPSRYDRPPACCSKRTLDELIDLELTRSHVTLHWSFVIFLDALQDVQLACKIRGSVERLLSTNMYHREKQQMDLMHFQGSFSAFCWPSAYHCVLVSKYV